MALYNYTLNEGRIHKEYGMKLILGKSKDAESFPKILKTGIAFFFKSFFTKKKCNTVMKQNKEISKERKRLEIFLG